LPGRGDRHHRQSGGNVSAAATRLGVSRATLHRKLKRLDLR
ncbi:hypothetical protein CNY89_04535, partial [Amaricoccus sp. HAR-UPW-R2A-40]